MAQVSSGGGGRSKLKKAAKPKAKAVVKSVVKRKIYPPSFDITPIVRGMTGGFKSMPPEDTDEGMAVYLRRKAAAEKKAALEAKNRNRNKRPK